MSVTFGEAIDASLFQLKLIATLSSK